MKEISYGTVLPIPVDEAFEFASEPANWPLFFESMRSAERQEGWGKVGGRAQVVTRFLGRVVTSELELTEWDPPRSFRYIMHQQGRPALDNNRIFEPAGTGTRLRFTTTAEARPGAMALVDWLYRRALLRMYRRAMARMPQTVRRTHQ
jgi:Polyketide cyclase / dehydrase and lipid transport